MLDSSLLRHRHPRIPPDSSRRLSRSSSRISPPIHSSSPTSSRTNNNPTAPTATLSPYQQTDNTAKVICILDYFSVLCLLGLFVEKDNPDVRFHTNQGLILFLLEVIICVVSAVLAGSRLWASSSVSFAACWAWYA